MYFEHTKCKLEAIFFSTENSISLMNKINQFFKSQMIYFESFERFENVSVYYIIKLHIYYVLHTVIL